VELLEPHDDGLFGGGVDRRGLVAADADREHRLALGSGRKVDEHLADVRGGGPAGLEPGAHASGWNSRPERSFG
jgi:hypothetical protein